MRKGFTLIELLATVVILGIIATITVPTMLERQGYFKDKAYENMISSVENATEQYIIDNLDGLDEFNNFGYINVTINELIEKGYLEGNLINPKTTVSIPLSDVVYVTRNYKNKIDTYYNPEQKEYPRIILRGPNIIKIKKGSEYTDLGAIAFSKTGTEITNQINTEGSVNKDKEGTYTIKYSVPDSIVLERYVIVTTDFPKNDIEKPVLSSNIINNYIETTKGVSFTMPIVTATDNVDGVVSPISHSSNDVNINQTGTYYIKYNYTDSSGNKAQTLIIKVVVKP